ARRATALPTDWLRAVLPLLLVAVALYFGFKRGVGELERHRRISPLLFGLLFVPAIGFYDGVFGPGTGSFLMLGFVSLAGFTILKATAHTKLLNFRSEERRVGKGCRSGRRRWRENKDEGRW